MFLFSKQIRTKLAAHFLRFEDYYIVDSMPIEICKFSRHNRIKICKDDFETAPPKVLVLLKTVGFTDISFIVFAQLLVFFIRRHYLSRSS
jgi:hypothetical protein